MSNNRAENITIGSRRVSIELQFSVNAPVRLFVEKHLGQLTMTGRIGGISTLVSPRPRRIDEGIQAIDE